MYSCISPYGINFPLSEPDKRAIENVCVYQRQRLCLTTRLFPVYPKALEMAVTEQRTDITASY